MKNTIHHRINKLCINAAARDISPGDKKRGPYDIKSQARGNSVPFSVSGLVSWSLGPRLGFGWFHYRVESLKIRIG